MSDTTDVVGAAADLVDAATKLVETGSKVLARFTPSADVPEESDTEPPPAEDDIPVDEELAMEVLFVRIVRFGENLWTFSDRCLPTLERLEDRGWVSVMHGVTENTCRARLTEAGKEAWMPSPEVNAEWEAKSAAAKRIERTGERDYYGMPEGFVRGTATLSPIEGEPSTDGMVRDAMRAKVAEWDAEDNGERLLTLRLSNEHLSELRHFFSPEEPERSLYNAIRDATQSRDVST